MDKTKRLLSLDVFRGLTIAFMILVNNPGNWTTTYAPLLHADWHGCTPTDLIFPFFLFIMGVAIPLALSKRLERGDEKSAIYKKILRRTLIIFGIGLFLNAFPYFDFGTLRIPGVLQRIALVYGVCAVLFVKTTWRTQVWVSIGLLLLYWFLMTVVPVPGYGAANLEPETNFGAWFDNTLLTGHLWDQAKVWDPEGILSTLPAIVTGMIGIFAGRWLQEKRGDYEKLTGLFAVGALLIALGLAWDLAFPINKKIWTSSYVLYVGGIGLQVFAITYWILDVLNYKKWIKPFVIFGLNPLILYALSSLIAKIFHAIKWTTSTGESESIKGWIYHNVFESIFSPYNASLGYALFNVAILLAIGWGLYVKKIFIKV